MNSMFKKFIKLAISVMLVLTGLMYRPMFTNAVNAEEGKITIDKVKDLGDDDGVYEITLSVQGNPIKEIIKKPVDVVLVLDRSGSMSGDRMAALKVAAKNFVDEILDYHSDSRIAIVSFATNITRNRNFTNNSDNLYSTINGLRASGGTHLEGGIREGYRMLEDNTSSHPKSMVIMGDGEPTYGYDWTGNRTDYNFNFNRNIGSGSVGYYNKGGTRHYHRDSVAHIAGWVKEKYDVYSIGLDVDDEGKAVLESTQNKGYWDATSEDLDDIFNEIANIVIQSTPAGTQAIVLDEIGSQFDFAGWVDDNGSSATIVGNTITWNLGDIPENTTVIKYKVKLKDTAPAGVHDTNEYAKLQYIDPAGEEVSENFPEPEVVAIRYVAESGGTVTRALESLDEVQGNPVGSKAIPNDDYLFVHWTDKDGIEVSDDAEFIPVKVNDKNVPATYYAHFVRAEDVTIKYVARLGGEVSENEETLAPVSGVAQGSEATALIGYEFVNWTDADDNVVETYAKFVPVKVAGVNVAATYYANFKEKNDVTINYEARTGGSVDPAFETLAPVTDDAEGSEATAAAGYVFVNWTDADDKVVGTEEEFVPERNDDGLNFAATYYANFEEAADITINYVANLGGSVDPKEETLAPVTDDAAGSEATAAAGYVFVNWTDADDKVVGTDEQFVPDRNDDGLNFAATYYANFEEEADITINYVANLGGSVDPEEESLAPATGKAQGSYATPNAGYEFVNWVDADDNEVGTNRQFIPSKNDEGLNFAATYYANFKEKDDVTINYEARTGGSVNPESETLAPVTDDAAGSEATAAAGYVFVNWTDADDNVVGTDEQFVPDRNDEGLNYAATYYANFKEENDVTINYEARTGGSVNPGFETLAPVTDDAEGSEATAAAGYVFVNWTDADDNVVGTDEQFIPERNAEGLNFAATYYANFEEKADITIYYIAKDGGTVNPGEESLAPATGEAQGSLATPSAGYIFTNWTNEDGDVVGIEADYIPKRVGGVNVPATYYANFKEKDKVTINYVANLGGSVDPEEESLAPATGVAQGSLATPDAGYVFVNWVDEEGKEVGTDAQFTPSKNDDGLNFAATYYANFEEKEDITINYVANLGGSVDPEEESLAPATGVAQGSLATPDAGYEFVNWVDEEGKEVGTDAQFTPSKNDDGLNFAATYYANFEEQEDITINYWANEGGAVSNASETLAPATGVAEGSEAAPDAGYVFVNWVDIEGNEVGTDPLFVPDKVEGLNVAADYYANFEAIDYTFTFDPNHGLEDVVVKGFNVGGSVSEELFDREGFTFEGWTTDADGEIPYDGGFDDLPAMDIYIYAQWEAIPEDEFVLTYVTNQPGLTIPSVTFKKGDALTPVIPSVEGFEFIGWFADEDLENEFDEFASMPARNVTVYAEWGEVLGDSDEEPEIPEMSDTNNTKYGFILFFLGLLAVLFSKKEEEEVY